jgi:hypothetical protein
MIRLATVLLIASVLIACGSETGGDDAAAAASSSSSSSGGANVCETSGIGPPSGSCNAGDTCSKSDGGCSFDSYCKDGTWAFVRECNNPQGCPSEGLTAGSACTDEGAQCLYNEGGACVADLECKGGVWVDSGC